MGCAVSTPSLVAEPEDPKTRELRLRAEKSAELLELMKAEVEAEKAAERNKFMTGVDMQIVAALQRLWYGTSIEVRSGASLSSSCSTVLL